MTTENNPWDDEAISSVAPTTTPTKKKKVVHESKTHKLVLEPVSTEFDLEGLMTDFPTAKELERFVFDGKCPPAVVRPPAGAPLLAPPSASGRGG
jgi:hypothetical protein